MVAVQHYSAIVGIGACDGAAMSRLQLVPTVVAAMSHLQLVL